MEGQGREREERGKGRADSGCPVVGEERGLFAASERHAHGRDPDRQRPRGVAKLSSPPAIPEAPPAPAVGGEPRAGMHDVAPAGDAPGENERGRAELARGPAPDLVEAPEAPAALVEGESAPRAGEAQRAPTARRLDVREAPSHGLRLGGAGEQHPAVVDALDAHVSTPNVEALVEDVCPGGQPRRRRRLLEAEGAEQLDAQGHRHHGADGDAEGYMQIAHVAAGVAPEEGPSRACRTGRDPRSGARTASAPPPVERGATALRSGSRTRAPDPRRRPA